MIKRFATTVALGTALALSVPTWVSGAEAKDYDELTDLQKSILQMRAVAQVEPEYAWVLLESDGYEVALEREQWSEEDARVFSGCYADYGLDYYKDINVIQFMNLSDDEIKAHIGNYSFDVGVQCAYEVRQERRKRRDA